MRRNKVKGNAEPEGTRKNKSHVNGPSSLSMSTYTLVPLNCSFLGGVIELQRMILYHGIIVFFRYDTSNRSSTQHVESGRQS